MNFLWNKLNNFPEIKLSRLEGLFRITREETRILSEIR